MGTTGRVTRSTAQQRQTLRRVEADLKEALETLPGRFYSTAETVEAYVLVLLHLKRWNQWESDEDD